ncbi:ATPase-AAA-core domain-containing protein [Mycena kentingensis (nom. inval.)]|nr:ATPase-AAA-core domain-containing protein [Mycena kentingensis (nom. inval.)]
MRSNPDAHELLQILSVLPDGLAEGDLQQHTIPIATLLECKTTVLRTALAYMTPSRRLNLLVPIREYIRAYHPPPIDLIRPIFRTYKDLLELFDRSYAVAPVGNLRTRVNANFANIQSLLAFRLSECKTSSASTAEAAELIPCGVLASRYSRLAGYSETPLVSTVISDNLFRGEAGSEILEVSLITEQLWMHHYKRTGNDPELINRAISLFPQFDDKQIKCELYRVASHVAHLRLGDLAAAESWAEEVIALSEPGSRMRAAGLRRRANLYSHRGNFVQARKLAKAAQKLYRDDGDLHGEATTLSAIAGALCNLGDFTKAAEAAKQGRTLLVLCEVPGSYQDLALLSKLGSIYHAKSEYREAKETYEEILRLSPSTSGDFSGMYISIILNVLEVEISLGAEDSEYAQRLLDMARQLASKLDWKLGMMICDATEGMLLLHRGNHDKAKSILEHTLDYPEFQVQRFCLENLADPNLWPASHYDAKWVYILIAQICGGIGRLRQPRQLYGALQFLGSIMLMDDDIMSAKNLLTVAFEGFTKLDMHSSIAECSLALAKCSEAMGNGQYALDLLDCARSRFERSSQQKQISKVENRRQQLVARMVASSVRRPSNLATM